MRRHVERRATRVLIREGSCYYTLGRDSNELGDRENEARETPCFIINALKLDSFSLLKRSLKYPSLKK